MLRSSLAAFALVLVALPAQAAPRHEAASLEYAPGSLRARCPSERSLHEQIAGHLGYDLFAEPNPAARLTVTVSQQGSGYAIDGELRGSAGESVWHRGFQDGDCHEAAAKLMLALAVHLTRMPEVRAAPPIPPSVPAHEESASRQETPEPDRALPPPTPPHRPRVQVGAGSFLALNSTPSPSAGLMLSLGVRFATEPAVSVELEGRGLVPMTDDLAGRAVPVSEVRSGLLTLAGVPCVRFSFLLGCGVAEVGRRQFSVTYGATAATQDSLHLGAGLRAGVVFPLTRWFDLRGYADFTASITEADLVVNQQVRWVSPPVAAALAVSGVASF
jgi:hypothetical protein